MQKSVRFYFLLFQRLIFISGNLLEIFFPKSTDVNTFSCDIPDGHDLIGIQLNRTVIGTVQIFTDNTGTQGISIRFSIVALSSALISRLYSYVLKTSSAK